MFNAKRFSFFEAACLIGTWFLRPLAVPLETLIHRRVGQRAPGLASLVALLVMQFFSLMAQDATLMHLLMFVFVVRVVAVIVIAELARRGGEPWSSRSVGTPWLLTFFPGLSGTVARCVEPFAALILAMIVKAINTAAGDYLELAAIALMAVNALRFAVTYCRFLDVVDEQVGARPVQALTGGSDEAQPNLPWTHGFPVEAAPATLDATESLQVA